LADHAGYGDGPARALQLRLHESFGAHIDDIKLSLKWRVLAIVSVSLLLWAAIGGLVYGVM